MNQLKIYEYNKFKLNNAFKIMKYKLIINY